MNQIKQLCLNKIQIEIGHRLRIELQKIGIFVQRKVDNQLKDQLWSKYPFNKNRFDFFKKDK